ncbi:protoheme IX farnesyltransferase [Rickettsia felis str. Pedreira]|uniref:Protoheme IX farnesyltransferase n=2 Tax=Rickettsia felis TaxID=42862 RepID=COXX_RICFE|nr:heme o synthase [Rickettsia felis]Q4UM22.1 RecName: Full=Protoheme IX farnesyltransferase; AltName: Full=Heme B farnesyltransferase; AltName: Full=Heme O synthase [Rickettsia felis URRWXCal2]AAY61401.1 Protoheme IX farnesyltransferase [Rickettsia felis URRWXCal2]KHO03835.1 protoheme IX farnesyltransferase [Rickettsia felis]KJV57914.1 protoheme IX farnesyltransferase [Rickettsia felis str. Pedreira]MDE8612001.1 heme o synthase [Rickettsia felis]
MSSLVTPINLDKINHSQSTVKDYILLMKPRVMSLVIFTGFVGIWLAPYSVHPFIAGIAVVCIALGAGSAGAINMWYDRDIDSLMKRTQKRPIVRGAIEPDEALSFGLITGFFAVFFMALCVNLLASFLLLFTIFYYICIYTIWLKRRSIQNIVIGGVSGALPPVIGYAAVSNTISLESIILFLIIFIWTPPHSWALALFCNDDYKNCKVPMMPAVKGNLYTKKQILIYSILLFIVSLMPFFIGMNNFIYLITSGILGLVFLYYSGSLFYDTPDNKQAKRFFAYSIFYLFFIFLLLSSTSTISLIS